MTDTARLSETTVGNLTWRAIKVSDIDQWLALLQRMAVVDKPDWVEAREDLEHTLTSSKDKPELDTLLGVEPDGTARAYAAVTKNPGSTLVHGSGGVDSDFRGRGVGTALLKWQQERSAERLTEDGERVGLLRTYVEERNSGQRFLMDASGAEVVRYFTEMTRPLHDEVPDVPLADQFEFVTFNDEISNAVRLAHNDAFRDHWGSEPRDEESWRFTIDHPEFRPDLSLAAVENATGEVAAYQMASFNPASAERTGCREGYTELLGVRRDWRGHRLAPALLAESMRRFRTAGMDNAGLGVDTENPSGALGLYERLGYVATHRSWVYDQTITA